MDIELDLDAVRAIIAREYQQARADIDAIGAVAAYEHSRKRHDERLADAPDAAILACRAGCSWCCYFSVDIRAVEALSIMAFVETELSSAAQARIRTEIEANASLLAGLSDEARMQRNIKCPFLTAGRCQIYSARPQTCRNYHATDVTGCEQSFNEPSNLEIDPDFAPLVYQFGGSHVEAFTKALDDAGYDVAAYELNGALAEAMRDPARVRRRFAAKEKTFTAIEGTHPDSEFLDN